MPIQVLPPELVSQIAAGEVVERPASVVKELIENSLDAGATRINIEIKRGGTKLIRILDNGCGIDKDQLALALSRHTTSKITSLDDLQSITSMGFRGEALASISSVSRLTLTSRPTNQNGAWQVRVEGLNMSTSLWPVAHPVGSSVEVLDLFYNIPARRKFMRTEKTEFALINEVIRCFALVRFNVTFILQHNGKIVHQYLAVNKHGQHLRRLRKLCGTTFVKHALIVSWEHSGLSMQGWIVDYTSDNFPEIRYSYVNQRMIRYKLINHAIRQAYQDKLVGTQQPAFVIFLDISPHQVDVNVHPSKYEVRFHQARLVHDFIYQGVITTLKNSSSSLLVGQKLTMPENRQTSGRNCFSLMDDETIRIGDQHMITNNSNLIDKNCNWKSIPGCNSMPVIKIQSNNDCHIEVMHTTKQSYMFSGKSTQSGVRPILEYESYYQYEGDRCPQLTQPPGVLIKEFTLMQDNIFVQSTQRNRTTSTPLLSYIINSIYPSIEEDVFTHLSSTSNKNQSYFYSNYGKPVYGNITNNSCLIDVLPIVRNKSYQLGKVLTIYQSHYALLEFDGQIMLLSLPIAERYLIECQLILDENMRCAQPLLIPLRIVLSEVEAVLLKHTQPLLEQIGIVLQLSYHQAILNAVPVPLLQQNLQNLISELLVYLSSEVFSSTNQVAAWFASQIFIETATWTHTRAIQMLAEIERLSQQSAIIRHDKLLVTLNLKGAIKALNYD